MRERNHIYFSYIYLVFLLATCGILLLQALWTPGSWLSNIYVPDSEIMYDNLVFITENDISFSQHLKGEDTRIAYYIYQPLYTLIKSPISFILTNISILSVAIFCIYKAFKPFGYQAALLSALSISLNPYILISITGISKEIPLCAVTNALLLVISKKSNIRIFILTLLCIIAYGVRPAYGVMLACYFLPYLLLTQPFLSIFQGIMPTVPFLFSFAFGIVAERLPIIKRMVIIQQGLDAGTELGRANLERAVSSLEAGGIASCIELLFRTFANVFSLILRPSFLTENNNFSVLGSSYWLYGLGISAALVGTFTLIFNLLVKKQLPVMQRGNYEYLKSLAFSIAYLVPAISLSLIIQPRYLMPILPISMGILGTLPTKMILRIGILLLLLSVFGYIYLTFFAGVEPIRNMDLPHKPDFVLSL